MEIMEIMEIIITGERGESHLSSRKSKNQC